MEHAWSWTALILLGAFHGLNPAMGWLFAVALGLQERRRAAVLAALPPIALGHAISIALVVAAVAAAATVLHELSPRAMAAAGGVLLIGFGGYRLVRQRHPRWVGMRVGFRDLTLWSFLMSSAHGAGLMLLPVLLHLTPGVAAPMAGTHAMSMGELSVSAIAAVAIHSGAMLAVMATVALVVYETLGVAVLRRVWINLDLIWGGALVVAGVVMLVPAVAR